MDKPILFDLISGAINFNLNDGAINFTLNAEVESGPEQGARILEDGAFRLLEDSGFRLLE